MYICIPTSKMHKNMSITHKKKTLKSLSKKNTAFCRVSLFIFGRSSYVTALEQIAPKDLPARAAQPKNES